PPAPTSDRRPARRGVGRAGGVAPGGVAGAAGRAGRRRCSVCAGAGASARVQGRRVYVMTCLRHPGLTRGRVRRVSTGGGRRPPLSVAPIVLTSDKAHLSEPRNPRWGWGHPLFSLGRGSPSVTGGRTVCVRWCFPQIGR